MKKDSLARLGKYTVLDEINSGGMGTVYLGHDPYADRRVAIKVAHSEQLDDDQTGERYRRMFFNEAHTAGRLSHPNIVGIYDAGIDGETCYIVMEYVEGGHTLKDYCRPDKLLPVTEVVEMAYKCSRALDYAHRQGVTHRDIKPTNILVTATRDIKIGDFSIAQLKKLDTTETLPLGMVGSPRYMSPEQLSEDYITNQSDLFSLGVLMYELLTGKHPFAADTFSRLVQKILYEEPPLVGEVRSEIEQNLSAIVARAMTKDRGARYQTGLELAADLSRAFGQLLRAPQANIAEEEKFNKIKNLDFFVGFPESEVWEIVRAGKIQEYADCEEIILEGDLDDSFFIIVHGEVTVRKGGKELRTLAVGDCFGEMGYLAKTTRIATIVANGPTSLLKLNSSVVSQVSLNCQVRFLKVFLRTLIHRLSVTTERISREEVTT